MSEPQSAPPQLPLTAPKGDLQETPFATLMRVCRARARLISSVVAIGTILAVVAGSQLTPKYTAQTSVMLAPHQNDLVGGEAVFASLSTDAPAVETQIKVIRSRDHAARVVAQLELERDPEFNGAPANPTDLTLRIGDPWGRVVAWLPSNWLIASGLAEEGVVAAVASADPEVITADVIDAFMDRSKVHQEGRSYVIAIGFTSTNPRKAAVIANKMASLYLADQLELKRSATAQASEWLHSRLEALRDEVEQAEQAVERYRLANDLQGQGGLGLDENGLAGLHRELLVAKAELDERRTRVEIIRDLQTEGQNLEAAPEVMASPLFAELWRQETELDRFAAELGTIYGQNHPRMEAIAADRANVSVKMAAEINRVVGNLETEADLIASRVAALEEQLDLVKDDNVRSRTAEVRLRELERQAAANRQLYETFLQRYGETREQLDIVEPDGRIIAKAGVPTKPSSPGPAFFGAFGFTASSLVGVLLALLIDRVDRGIRSGKQLEAMFQLQCLSMVPKLKPKLLAKGRRPHQYLLDKPLSAYAEAMRSIQLGIALGDDEQPAKVIQITSSTPDEGKSTLAVSFATSLAQSGKRVLLFELDLRHPAIRQQFDIEIEPDPDDPAEIFSPPLPEPTTGVDLMLVRRRPNSPNLLLGSQTLSQLFRRLRHRYDYIVVDSAPLLGVTDSKFIANLADAVILVVRWQTTGADLVTDALKELEDVPTRLAGAVITQVDFDRQARYGYGGIDRYYGKYKKYYED